MKISGASRLESCKKGTILFIYPIILGRQFDCIFESLSIVIRRCVEVLEHEGDLVNWRRMSDPVFIDSMPTAALRYRPQSMSGRNRSHLLQFHLQPPKNNSSQFTIHQVKNSFRGKMHFFFISREKNRQ